MLLVHGERSRTGPTGFVAFVSADVDPTVADYCFFACVARCGSVAAGVFTECGVRRGEVPSHCSFIVDLYLRRWVSEVMCEIMFVGL